MSCIHMPPIVVRVEISKRKKRKKKNKQKRKTNLRQKTNLPPPGRFRAKGAGLAGTGAARGAGGRGGPAPSPRAPSPRHSLSYARPSAAFRVHARSAVSPPPPGRFRAKGAGLARTNSNPYSPLTLRPPIRQKHFKICLFQTKRCLTN